MGQPVLNGPLDVDVEMFTLFGTYGSFRYPDRFRDPLVSKLAACHTQPRGRARLESPGQILRQGTF